MTHNTTSYGGDFTIKPLTTSIDFKTERQLIAAWSMAGLSDSQIIKVLKLYFGEPAWMNTDKVYDCNMFGQIAKGLKFHNRHTFVELIIKCKGFGFIWKNVCGLDRSGILKHYSCLNLQGRDVSGVYEQKARVGVVYPEQTP